ncbi:MAG: RNA pseudouridine synthase [Acidobacteria bacterium]|nr:RNA pseudouridine synthase [Acidobacteriota bacterium]
MKKSFFKDRTRKPRPEKTADDRRKPEFSRELPVLYEDDALIIVDKPAGLLAVPIPGSRTPSALSLVTAKLGRKKQRAMVVHRIDRFASGALVFAKTSSDRHALVQQFLAHTPVRHYVAVVRGRLQGDAATLVHHFRRQETFQQLRNARDPKAARAELKYVVERRFAEATLVRVELITGLQNQIRAQFSAMGHPIIGDRKYHRQEARELRIARVALHAAHLQFVHPRSEEKVSVHCKLARDIQHLVQELSRQGVAGPKPPSGGPKNFVPPGNKPARRKSRPRKNS